VAFYTDISKYYDKIFPISKVTVDFLKDSLGNPPKNVLDVACGTGEYALELEKQGYNLKAIDLDSKMIEKLREKAKKNNSKVSFMEGNMINLGKDFSDEKFDAIYCIGNSLVHLDNLNEIQVFFQDVRKLLNEDGIFIFQIINYDRIIAKELRSLPTIENKEVPLKFERLYNLDEATGKIIFKTILHVDNKEIINEVNLIPLMYDDAISMLKSAGFNKVKAYGDFRRSCYDKENSYALILEARQ